MKLSSFVSILSIQYASPFMLNSPSSKRPRANGAIDRTSSFSSPHVDVDVDVNVNVNVRDAEQTHDSPSSSSQRLKMADVSNANVNAIANANVNDLNLMNTTFSSETDGQEHEHAAISISSTKDNCSIDTEDFDCPSLNILLDIISKINELSGSGSHEIFEDENLVKEALTLLGELTVRAEAAINMERIGDSDINIDIKKQRKQGGEMNMTSNIETATSSEIGIALAEHGLHTAKILRELMSHHGPARGKGRKALISTISFIIDEQSPAKILAVVMVVAALALPRNINHPVLSDEDHRSVSRSAVSGLLPNGRYQSSKSENDLESIASIAGNTFGGNAVRVLIGELAAAASPSNGQRDVVIDLHIVTSLARSFVSDRLSLASTCAACIREILSLEQNTELTDRSNYEFPEEVTKLDITGALGLASELGPWSRISPVPLIEISMDRYYLWHAAERLCKSAVKFNSPDSREGVHTLVDGLRERRMYRQSDVIATKFYDNGGMSRYAEARYAHACETIAKVVVKRQFPILERQVERVDRAVERVRKDDVSGKVDVNEKLPEEVRVFALTKLSEINEHDAAHRLAQLWNMIYWYDENEVEMFIKARLEKYIQWKDVFPHEASKIPDVISSPNELIDMFNELVQTVENSLPIIGFDAEWSETCKGVALLQLSTTKKSILIDVPALLKSIEGCNSLEKTVGDLFAGRIRTTTCSSIVAAGFSCREDISHLRKSTGVRSSHWFTSTERLVDTKPIIAAQQTKLKHLGLSRICEHYLGKPLDKAEQCSLWDRRPLSLSQRAYAALDAWAVVAICSKLDHDFTSSSP